MLYFCSEARGVLLMCKLRFSNFWEDFLESCMWTFFFLVRLFSFSLEHVTQKDAHCLPPQPPSCCCSFHLALSLCILGPFLRPVFHVSDLVPCWVPGLFYISEICSCIYLLYFLHCVILLFQYPPWYFMAFISSSIFFFWGCKEVVLQHRPLF